MPARPAKTKSSKCTRGCGQPSGGKTRCSSCLERHNRHNRQTYRERVLRGQCTNCMSGAEVGIFCFTHWLKNVGVPHKLGNKQGTALLRRLWESQKGYCAITGEVMVPGSTASLDHIIPKSRGGQSDEGNLQWVLLRVNRLKWDMTYTELIQTCRQVLQAHDQRAHVNTRFDDLRSN